MINIVVTGPGGIFGGAILGSLCKTNSRIMALYRTRKGAQEQNVRWIQFDLANFSSDSISEVLEQADVLILNGASKAIGNNEQELQELQHVNVDSTHKLVNAAGNARVKQVIFTSSLSLLEKPLPNTITEDSPIAPVLHYSKSKFNAESIVLKGAERFGFQPVILRISSPVGSDLSTMPNTVLKKWIQSAQAREPITVYGTGSRTQDFVSDADLGGAFASAISSPKAFGIYNIASGVPVSMGMLAKHLAYRFSVPVKFQGGDINEGDRWNISIAKAKSDLGYIPNHTSIQAVNRLLETL